MSIEDDAENASRRWRKLLGIDHQTQINLIDVLNAMRSEGHILDWVVVNDEEMPGAEARFDPETRRILVSQTTYDGILHGHQRSNFSVAHEIGHVADKVTEMRNRGSARGRRTSRDEKFADSFAAGFLAPMHKADFDDKTTPEDLRRKFNLSASAARRRYEELSRQFRTANKRERELPSTVINFLKEARARGRSVKSLSPDIVSKAVTTQSADAATRAPATVEETCTVCGWPRLELEGPARVRCPKCKATYGRFQDGDSAAGL